MLNNILLWCGGWDVDKNKTLDLSSLEGWLWEAACAIRGEIDAPKFKDYILPLIFLKRLSDVYDDELARLAREFGNAKFAMRISATSGH